MWQGGALLSGITGTSPVMTVETTLPHDSHNALSDPVSMQSEFAADRLELRRLDQLAVSHLHRMQWPFKLFLPEREKTLQLGKLGEQVVILPDVGLQQPAMIGTPVQDVGGRQAITTDLFTEIL
jgi:hypothetical protein